MWPSLETMGLCQWHSKLIYMITDIQTPDVVTSTHIPSLGKNSIYFSWPSGLRLGVNLGFYQQSEASTVFAVASSGNVVIVSKIPDGAQNTFSYIVGENTENPQIWLNLLEHKILTFLWERNISTCRDLQSNFSLTCWNFIMVICIYAIIFELNVF